MRRAGVKLEQGFADRLRDQAPDLGFLMEFHFALGRMDVDVHRRRIDLQKKTTDRVASFHQGSVVTFEQGEVEAAIFDGAPVDEEMLVFAGRARNTRRSDETPDAKLR